jgi:NAD-dependent deacetylase
MLIYYHDEKGELMEESLRNIIETSRRLVFFGGAGVSTESGIPDFRSETGLYNTIKKYGHAPEDIISHSFFLKDPEIFYDFYKNNMIYTNAKPNSAHIALAAWENQGILAAVITQNIDGLHQDAGSKNVFELHGSVRRNYCMECNRFYPLEYIMDGSNCKRGVPVCSKCGGMVKPDVVLYEEGLNGQVIEGAINSIADADVMIVGGTSLMVYPAAGLAHGFRGEKLILINKGATALDGRADMIIGRSIGEVLGELTDLRPLYGIISG